MLLKGLGGVVQVPTAKVKIERDEITSSGEVTVEVVQDLENDGLIGNDI